MRNIVWSMSISHMFIEVYFLMHLSLIPVFINEFHLTLFEASLLVTVPTLIGLMTSICAGVLVDKIGAKPILILGIMLRAVGGLLAAESWSIESLILGITCIYVASPLYHNSGYSTISRALVKQGLSRALGIHNAMGSVGASLGLLSLPIILTYRDWRFAYLIWVIPMLTWSLLLLRVRLASIRSTREREVKPPRSIFTKGFVSFLLTIGIRQAGVAVILTFITTYMVFTRGFSETTATLIFGLGPPIGILSGLSAGYLGSILGDRRVLSLTIVGAAVSVIVMPLSPTMAFLALAFICFTFFNDAVWTPVAAITADLTPPSRRGLAYSLTMSTTQVMFAGTPPLAANLIEFTSLLIMFPLSFILISISLIILRISSSYDS